MIVLTGLTGYAAPDVPPAIREVVREVHGEDAAGSPVPEVAEALHQAHERRRRTATNPKRLRNVMRGLSPPRCASPPSHCGYAFVRPSAERRPPKFHQRYARSFVRFTAKTPQAAPSQREPKRCTCRRPWDVSGLAPMASHMPVVLVAPSPVGMMTPLDRVKSSAYRHESSVVLSRGVNSPILV